MKNIVVYADGSYRKSMNIGGWAFLLSNSESDTEILMYGSVEKTNSNRMELIAVLNALSYIDSKIGVGYNITIYTDSKHTESPINKKYLNDWVDSGFKGKKDVDLWVKIYAMLFKHNVKIKWIKSHNGNENHDLVDYYANLVCEENFNTELSFTIRKKKK